MQYPNLLPPYRTPKPPPTIKASTNWGILRAPTIQASRPLQPQGGPWLYVRRPGYM